MLFSISDLAFEDKEVVLEYHLLLTSCYCYITCGSTHTSTLEMVFLGEENNVGGLGVFDSVEGLLPDLELLILTQGDDFLHMGEGLVGVEGRGDVE